VADNEQPPIYSIDSSALIHGWVRAYPPRTFPTVWERLDELVANGLLRASVEVLNELEKQDDDLHAWCKERIPMFVDVDDAIQGAMQHIMGTYPKLVDTGKGKSGADPFVIAVAMVHNPTLTVVTEERGGSAAKPKIPFVCRQERLPSINLLQLIEEQNWKFK
jgi:hypothetical protein